MSFDSLQDPTADAIIEAIRRNGIEVRKMNLLLKEGRRIRLVAIDGNHVYRVEHPATEAYEAAVELAKMTGFDLEDG